MVSVHCESLRFPSQNKSSDAYKIGQGIAFHFSYQNRVFLSGDAVHTHSPKMGQGMNVAMQDTYNIGWKLGLVLSNICHPSILETYEFERRQVALDLIAMDRQIARFYSNGPGEETKDFKTFRRRFDMFLSGVAVEYDQSILIAKAPSPMRNQEQDSLSNSKSEEVDSEHLALVGIQVWVFVLAVVRAYETAQVLVVPGLEFGLGQPARELPARLALDLYLEWRVEGRRGGG